MGALVHLYCAFFIVLEHSTTRVTCHKIILYIFNQGIKKARKFADVIVEDSMTNQKYIEVIQTGLD